MLDQLNGVWAVESGAFRSMASLIQTPHASAGRTVANARPSVSADRNIAVIPVVGLLTKYGGLLSQLFGGTSTVDLRSQLGQAADATDIDGILLYVDSPGGQSKGNDEAASAVAAAAKKKPVFAYIEDLGASAAIAVISGATKIFANAPALVGCIGTYSVMVDGSKAAEKSGHVVHVIKAGQFKGMGQYGTEVTDEQLAEAQRIVDSTNSFFLAAIARGRKMTMKQVQELADGRIHPAADAKKLGLIDGVQSFDETLRQLVAASRRTPAVSAQPANSFTPPATPQPAATAERRLSKAERRQALSRGWNSAVQLEVRRGHDPIEARSRARRNHPELWRQFMLAIGQNVD